MPVLRARIRLIVVICLMAALSAAQTAGPRHAPLVLTSPVKDKNFYLLSLLGRDRDALRALEADPGLNQLTKDRREAVAQALEACRDGVACLLTPFRVSEAEVAVAEAALRRLYQSNRAVRRVAEGPLRDSGAYVRHRSQPAVEVLALAWREAAAGINRIIDVYGEGKPPRSGEIDAVSYDVKSPLFRLTVRTTVGVLNEAAGDHPAFFGLPLEFALHLLEINMRDEAGRHEPMELKDNAAAVRYIRTIAWDRFPYSVIVVPGSGTDRLSWKISGASKLRAELAARRFREKKAPLILVSGGYVHPNQTPYSEGIEMKKYLVENLGIPAEVVIVEPHARHTTTNMRNAARLLYRYGIPFEKKALVTTDASQSASIESPEFGRRCVREMGYEPQKILARISPFDLEFVPVIDSLHIDPLDPLDP